MLDNVVLDVMKPEDTSAILCGIEMRTNMPLWSRCDEEFERKPGHHRYEPSKKVFCSVLIIEFIESIYNQDQGRLSTSASTVKGPFKQVLDLDLEICFGSPFIESGQQSGLVSHILVSEMSGECRKNVFRIAPVCITSKTEEAAAQLLIFA
jgi:hypothetical protein